MTTQHTPVTMNIKLGAKRKWMMSDGFTKEGENLPILIAWEEYQLQQRWNGNSIKEVLEKV